MIPGIMHFVTWPILTVIFRLFVKLKIINRENLKGIKGPVIFVSNHKSYFDPYIIGMGIPWFSKLHPVYYFAKDNLFNNNYLKICLKLYGAFPGQLDNGVECAIKKPMELLKENKSVGIFTEWCYEKESFHGNINKLIFLLSKKSRRPIIPVFIFGIDGIEWKKIFFRQKEIMVIFGKPLFITKDMAEEKAFLSLDQALRDAREKLLKIIHREEKKFWNGYGKFYHYLERAAPYQQLVDSFKKLDKISGVWLDLGSGSGAIAEILIKKRENENTEIIASDFEQGMIDDLKKRFKNTKNILITEVDLCQKSKFDDNSLDGVTANLVLSYIPHYELEVGLDAFKKILQEIYRILKPDGTLLWSSPKHKVKFWKVFVASWKNVFDPKNLNHIYYGPAILKQALRIQEKGRREVYHFLETEKLRQILSSIGFIDISFERSMAGQVDVIKCKKPQYYGR